jgi:trehalose/maltose hydrolase-like predicted phosphorylase
VMAGTVLVAIQSFAGVDIRDGQLSISPALPDHWRKISFNLGLQKDRCFIEVERKRIKVKITGQSKKVLLTISGKSHTIQNGRVLVAEY